MLILQEWHDKIVKELAETPLYEPVKYTVRDIANKMAILDREVKYLVNKAKIWKPKPKEEPAKNKTDESTIETPEGSETPELPVGGDDDTVKTKEQEEKEETVVEDENDGNVESSDDKTADNVTEETLQLPAPDATESSGQGDKDPPHQEL